MSTTFTDKRPRARKAHHCYLCGYDIERGTVHVYRTGVSDGEWWTMRAHRACERYAVEEDLYDPDYGIDEGAVWRHVSDEEPNDLDGHWCDEAAPAKAHRGAERVIYVVAVAARLTLLGGTR